jgi:hypothetical protein
LDSSRTTMYMDAAEIASDAMIAMTYQILLPPYL